MRSSGKYYLTIVILGILMYFNRDFWNTTTIISRTRNYKVNDTVLSLHANNTLPSLRANIQLGSTGTSFLGNKIRKYKTEQRLFLSPSSHKSSLNFPNPTTAAEESEVNCDQWAVVTTILKPTVAFEKILALASKWCLVIVGDEITPNEDYEKLAAENEDVFYLSAEYQKKHALQQNNFVSKLPFRSFARKNVGYLFAIYYGAKVIFDFDDDNVLTSLKEGTAIPPPFLWNKTADANVTTNIWQESSMLLKFINDDQGENKKHKLSFNPYKYMGPSLSYSWPRGFPIDHLQDDFEMEPETLQLGDLPHSAIGVIQSLCNGDPDTDAVFRMTRPQSTNFTFDRTAKSLPLLVPLRSYSPYNAQATTHLRAAFWGLYLPISVPGRVTDIWRSYIVQRIMKDVGLYLVYTPPIVEHKRTSHDYLSDHAAETDLHLKTSKLLEHLDHWSSSKEHLAERIMDLWVDLYEHGYIEVEDVEAILEWLDTLTMIGYEYPSPLSSRDANTKIPRLQPTLEDQPYRAKPYYNVDGSGNLFSVTGRLGVEQYIKNISAIERPESAVVKIILMTMDEWPLLKGWVTYHGELFGFQNLYIIDSSTNEHAISFLVYARDILGVNVLFSNANLNGLMSIMTRIGHIISGSSDFIIKLDTDEYLGVFDDKSISINPLVVKGYLSDFKNNASHPLRQYDDEVGMCVSYSQNTVPSQEVCDQDVHATVEKFPLSLILYNDNSWRYKAVFDSRYIHKYGINLGGHASAFTAGCVEKTAFGVIHAHSRCVEMEMEMNQRVMQRHGVFNVSDSFDVMVAKLKYHVWCTMIDDCSCKPLKKPFSFHKVPPLITWLLCPERAKAEYYSMPSNLTALNLTLTNDNFAYFMTSSLEKYGGVE